MFAHLVRKWWLGAKSETMFSLVVIRTIACVNKMRVNKYVYQKYDVVKMLVEINPGFHMKHRRNNSILFRCNYLGFHITYIKLPIMYIRVCFVWIPILRFLLSQWHILPNPSQLRHNANVVNKLNEFKDVQVWAHVFQLNHWYTCLLPYHMSGEHWTCSKFEHTPVY